MSKLIVEIEMPSNCFDCILHCDVSSVDGNGYCRGIPPYMDCDCRPSGEMRPSWCPICGVLPDEHGDLIDRDAFIHKYLAFYTEQERKKNLVFAAVEVKQQFADMICDERALIAAERKDDETCVLLHWQIRERENYDRRRTGEIWV